MSKYSNFELHFTSKLKFIIPDGGFLAVYYYYLLKTFLGQLFISVFAALDYTKTTNYYWSQIDIKDVTGLSAGKQGQKALDKVTGPFGFDEAVELGEGRCLTKSEYKVKPVECIHIYCLN